MSRAPDRWRRWTLAAALLPAIAWGGNFVVIKLGLQFYGVFTLTALRFLMIALALPVIGWPRLPGRTVALYTAVSAFGQYTLSTLALRLGLSAGLASLLMQSQVFFAALLGYFVLGEKPSAGTLLGVVLGFSGIGVLTFSSDQSFSLLGLGVCLAGALSWCGASMQLRLVRAGDVVPLQAASSALACPLVAALGYWLDPVPLNIGRIASEPAPAAGVLLYSGVVSLFAAQAVWGWLLARLPLNTVTPFALLIPVFGLLFAWLFLGEHLSRSGVIASALVFAGLVAHFAGIYRSGTPAG